jgi:drug/metabolite transporter (DMT)-like permease
MTPADRLRTARPAALLVVSATLFAIMATAAKQASALGGAEVAFLRSTFGVVACVLAHFFVRPLVAHNRAGLLARGSSGALAVYAYFLAIEHLPVGIATLLNYTAPVFTALWCVIFFREHLARRAFLALALTTFGLVLVIHGRAPPGTLGLGRWEIVGMCGALCSGISMALIGEVRKTDGAWEVFAVFCVACSLVTLPRALSTFRSPTWSEWGALAVVGASSVGAQVIMTHAMGRVRATLAGIVNQLTPAVSLLLGWLLYGDRFGRATQVGIALVLLGGATGAALTHGRRAEADLS